MRWNLLIKKIKKLYFSLAKKPYFDVEMKYVEKTGQIIVEADYNMMFLKKLEEEGYNVDGDPEKTIELYITSVYDQMSGSGDSDLDDEEDYL